MNILVVDDSKAIYAMVSQVLVESGYTSTWAGDGLIAVEKLAEHRGLYYKSPDHNDDY